MNLRDLDYICAVADHKHFGRAAEFCNVSQPTLSGQIKKLEEQLGVTLFERSHKETCKPRDVRRGVGLGVDGNELAAGDDGIQHFSGDRGEVVQHSSRLGGVGGEGLQWQRQIKSFSKKS